MRLGFFVRGHRNVANGVVRPRCERAIPIAAERSRRSPPAHDCSPSRAIVPSKPGDRSWGKQSCAAAGASPHRTIAMSPKRSRELADAMYQSDRAGRRGRTSAPRRNRSPGPRGRDDRIRDGAITPPRESICLDKTDHQLVGAHDDRQRYRDDGVGRRSASCLLASTWLLAIRPSVPPATRTVCCTAGSAPLIAGCRAQTPALRSWNCLRRAQSPRSRRARFPGPDVERSRAERRQGR